LYCLVGLTKHHLVFNLLLLHLICQLLLIWVLILLLIGI
jgi:hypothetical protein